MLLLVTFAPAVCLAETVAVLPVAYESPDGGVDAASAAAKVEEKVAEGAREAGFEVMRGEEVAKAAREAAGGAACDSSECLARMATALGVDEAIFVRVVDSEQTSYSVTVAHARRATVEDEKTAGFFVVLEWLRGKVAVSLQRSAPVEAKEPVGGTETAVAAVKAPVEGTEGTEGKEEDDGAAGSHGGDGTDAVADGGRKLAPAVFWTSAAITGALLVSWGVTDIVVHSRYKDLEGGDLERDEWLELRDSTESLQVADRVLLGLFAAGVVTTGVLFFFTKFERGEDAKPGVTAVEPVALDGGGGFVLRGRF